MLLIVGHSEIVNYFLLDDRNLHLEYLACHDSATFGNIIDDCRLFVLVNHLILLAIVFMLSSQGKMTTLSSLWQPIILGFPIILLSTSTFWTINLNH